LHGTVFSALKATTQAQQEKSPSVLLDTMEMRKVPENGEEKANKRRRFEEGAAPTVPYCFDDLNNDCLVHIMSFLPSDDMNSVACMNHQCREARSNESLDQTRTGTIICSRAKNATVTSLSDTLNNASRAFTANYKHLKIVGLEVLEEEVEEDDYEWVPIEPLAHVTTLELASNPTEPNESTLIARTCQSMVLLSLPFRNVTELILGHERLSKTNLHLICERYKNLVRVTWKGGLLDLEGDHFGASASLTELVIDGCRLVFDLSPIPFDVTGLHRIALGGFANELPAGAHDRETNPYAFMQCQHLERLSMKNTTCSISYSSNAHMESMLQEIIMKMVRHHPTLRWLRSDLTPENVAILQQARPEITFVTD